MKVILWFQTLQMPLLNAALNVVARTYGALEFVGALSSEKPILEKGITINSKPIPLLDEKTLASIEYDIVLVFGDKISMPAVLKEAMRLGLEEDKIVLDRTVCVPGFTLEKYKQLRHSQLSIFSKNCWGGLICHLFGLQFRSPTVNLFVMNFMKLFGNPQYYFEKELRYFKLSEGNFRGSKWKYPTFLLGDIEMHMLHYNNIDQAREQWERRRLKINWYNALIMTFTEDRKILEEFDQLPFAKKVCYVPFQTDLNSGYYIPQKIFRGHSFEEAVLDTAHNFIHSHDLWDMLLYGKKTPLNQ